MSAAREFVFGWLGWLLVEAFDKSHSVVEWLVGERAAERFADRTDWLYRAGCRSYAFAYKLGGRYAPASCDRSPKGGDANAAPSRSDDSAVRP